MVIFKNKGKGSLALDVNKVAFPVSGVTSFKELAKTISGNYYKIRRVRSFDGEWVILDTDYLNTNIVLNVTNEIAGDSLYSYIENELGLKLSFV